jgi:3-hydroxyacyl-[acyl-carrier-protein] dehydratase
VSAGLPAPSEVLPHRPPFLFLDEVVELEPGRAARGRWQVHGTEEFFAGHFPGRPMLPGVLMLESIAQLGAYAVLAGGGHPDRLPVFGGADQVRFRRPVAPGDTLDLEVELVRLSARGGRGRGRATVTGATACEADLLFVLVDT